MLLSDLMTHAALDLPSFVKRHPEPILVSWSSDDDESPTGFHTPDGGSAIGAFVSKTAKIEASDQTPRENGTPIPSGDLDETEVVSRPGESLLGALSSGDSEHAGAATAVRPAMDLVCLPLVKSNRNPFTQMVTAGRTPNNDIVLRDSTVSKFHAYFTRRGTTWWLHDQGSTNGSFVARNKVGTGGAALSNGARVSFGQRLLFRFFTPEGLHELLRQ